MRLVVLVDAGRPEGTLVVVVGNPVWRKIRVVVWCARSGGELGGCRLRCVGSWQFLGAGLWILWEAVGPGDVHVVLGCQRVRDGWDTVVVVVVVVAGGGELSMVAGLVVTHLN